MEVVVEHSKMIAPEATEAEAQKIEEDLLDYCERDTWATVVTCKNLADILRLGDRLHSSTGCAWKTENTDLSFLQKW